MKADRAAELRMALAEHLLGSAERASQAAGRIIQGNDSLSVIHLATAWGALPRFQERLERLGVRLPAAADSEMQRLSLDGYVRSILQARSGIHVLEELSRSSIRAVAIKGLVSMASLYDTPAQRVMIDADILIHRDDLESTATLLQRLGYRPEIECSLSQYVDFVRRSPGFGGNEELSFQDDRGNTIDLHWWLGAGFDPAVLLDHAEYATLAGSDFPAVSATDHLLLCVHHSLRNHFDPAKMIRDLFDAERSLGRRLGEDDLDTLIESSRRCGLAGPLGGVMLILAACDPDGPVAAAASRFKRLASPEERRAARQLSKLFFTQLRDGSIDRDVLYFFRPTEMAQLFGGLVRGGRQHLALAGAMDAAMAGEEASFARRIQHLWRAVRAIRWQHVPLLLSLARSKDEFSRRT